MCVPPPPPPSRQNASDASDAAVQAIIQTSSRLDALLAGMVDLAIQGDPITDQHRSNIQTVLHLTGAVQQQTFNAVKEVNAIKAGIAQQQITEKEQQINLEHEFQRKKFEAEAKEAQERRAQEIHEWDLAFKKSQAELEAKKQRDQQEIEHAKLKLEKQKQKSNQEIAYAQLELQQQQFESQAYLQEKELKLKIALAYNSGVLPKQLKESTSSTKTLTYKKN